jgi:hypothetical protein
MTLFKNLSPSNPDENADLRALRSAIYAPAKIS